MTGDAATQFDPDELSGFPQHLFKSLRRFREVAVDNHLANGNLEDVEYHERRLVSGDTLVQEYDPPVVFTVLSGYDGEASTVSEQDDELNVEAACFTWNYDLQYGLEQAVLYVSRVIDNVENNRSLESSPGAGDPIAEDVTWGSLDPDYQFAEDADFAVSWASVSFTVELRRRRPR